MKSVFSKSSSLAGKGLSALYLLMVVWGCKEDKPFESLNQAPTTRIAIQKINLADSVRLITRVKLAWTGYDKDGYVVGYRMGWATDPGSAQAKLRTSSLINRTDSTFLFNFSGSSDTANIYFYIQAEDDKGLVDPNPAFLKIPVKNSKPSISFLADGLPLADSIYSVFSFPFNFSDPDGAENIDSVLIRINNGPWVSIPGNTRFLSLVPEDPASIGITNAWMYAGENLSTLNREPEPLKDKIPGLRIGGQNRIYLKIKDLAGAFSVDSTPIAYYFRPKTSDLLLVDAYRGEGAFISDQLYDQTLAPITSYDKMDVLSFSGKNEPKFWNSTFYLQCKQYKKVFWYSDVLTNLPGQTQLMLTKAAAALIQYLRFNGKLLVSATFPDAPNQLPDDDAVFALLPVQEISPQSNNIRLRRNVPILSKRAGFPDLQSTNNIITGIDIFTMKPGADTLYLMPKESLTTTYTGPSLPIALSTRNPFFNRLNLAFFGMELTYLSGDQTALQTMLAKILNEEFNW